MLGKNVQSVKSYKRAHGGCLRRKIPMKDVVVCDKPREADKQALYPGISEWRNPMRVMSH